MKAGIDYLGVGVGAVIINEGGEIFLARRGPLAKNEKGCWEFPGGSVEFGEKLADALKREIMEEYGLEVIVEELLGVANHILPDEGQHWVSPAFICKPAPGSTPRILERGKCTEIAWFKLNDFPPNLSKATRINLEQLKERKDFHYQTECKS